MYACKWLGAITLCLTATLAQGAGIRAIDIPASADGGELRLQSRSRKFEPMSAFFLIGS